MHVYTQTHIYMYTHVHTYIYTHSHIHKHTCTHAHVHTSTYTHKHTHTHTNIVMFSILEYYTTTLFVKNIIFLIYLHFVHFLLVTQHEIHNLKNILNGNGGLSSKLLCLQKNKKMTNPYKSKTRMGLVHQDNFPSMNHKHNLQKWKLEY